MSNKTTGQFETEEHLVQSILSFVRRSGSTSFRAELEVDAGVGFADIVLYKRQPRTKREVQLLATIPARLSPLLAPLTAGKIASCEDLAASLGLPKAAAQRVLRQFQHLGLLKDMPAGFIMPSINISPFQSIISIEAKLSDWSRALIQAYRNRQFADESWVVLDHRFYKSALGQLERFQRSGVGLASVDVSGSVYIHFHAPSAPAMNETKRWHAQATLARRALRNISDRSAQSRQPRRNMAISPVLFQFDTVGG